MNGEICFVCSKPMGNSLHKVGEGEDQAPVHKHCWNELATVDVKDVNVATGEGDEK